MSRPDLGERSPNDLETPQRARVMSEPFGHVASSGVRPGETTHGCQSFDHLAIVEPESVAEVGRSGPIVHVPVTLGDAW
jgi:hypothetical protein